MVKGRRTRAKGKISLSKWFRKFKDGERVAIIRNLGVRAGFPKRIGGKTGKIAGSKGRFKLVKLQEGNKIKTFIIHSIHLRALRTKAKETKNGN